jgi:hypothetical protein
LSKEVSEHFDKSDGDRKKTSKFKGLPMIVEILRIVDIENEMMVREKPYETAYRKAWRSVLETC